MMSSDRHYMFARTRNRGFRKGQRGAALSALQIEKEMTCEVVLSSNVEPLGSASVVSPAISHAVANGREKLIIEANASKSCNQSGGNSEPQKPNCYTCAHRTNLAGDAHSSCNALGASGIPISLLFAMGRTEIRAGEVHIRGNSHGVFSGWFCWPVNFDPVWLEICSLYKNKEQP